MVIRNLYVLYVSMFIVGFSKSICIIQGFPFFIEALPFHLRNLVGTFIGVVDKVMLIMCIFYLKAYGPNWITIMIPAIGCLALSGLLSFFLLDSP